MGILAIQTTSANDIREYRTPTPAVPLEEHCKILKYLGSLGDRFLILLNFSLFAKVI